MASQEPWVPYFINLDQRYVCSRPWVYAIGVTFDIGTGTSLIEVAVDPSYAHISSTLSCFLPSPGRIPVSIETLTKIEAVNQLGYEGAYNRELFRFLSNAGNGILKHGLGLGQFYRERYPKLGSWIEYFILMHDLQVSGL